MRKPYNRQNPRSHRVLTMLGLLLAAGAAIAGESVPRHAERLEVSPNVVIRHWTLAAANGTDRDIRGLVRISEWPAGSWGAEITMTPIPDCCGAIPRTVRWRKSEPEKILYLGTIDADSKYRLSFRFK